MSTNRKIVVKYQNTNNETKTKTLSFANPNVADSVLSGFAEDVFNDLTTNTIISTQKVDTTDITGA